MAKHDRITIHLQDAPPVTLVARGAGATVDFETGREWTTATEMNAGSPPKVIREAKVRTGAVLSIVRDRTTDDPAPAAPRKRTPRPTAPHPLDADVMFPGDDAK